MNILTKNPNNIVESLIRGSKMVPHLVAIHRRILMDFIKDLLAALSVILNGLPQGLLALSYGFSSVATGLAFAVGAIGCLLFGVVAPVSFQAETITLAGTMGRDMKERISMIIYAAIGMTVIGILGLLERIVTFIGPEITNGMMAGVGIILAKVSLEMANKNKYVGYTSICVSLITYMFTQDLVYTITFSVVISSIVAMLMKQKSNISIEKREKLALQKTLFNATVFRGALALICLNIGSNIAFGKITGNIANLDVNIDHLSIVSSLADLASALFGGGPVESIISATGGAPHPLMSAVLMMALMSIILFTGLLPRIGKYIPSESIAGFLFVLGAIVTVPVNALNALSAEGVPGGALIGGITLTVTAISDPFFGMLAGVVLRFFARLFGM